MSRDPSCNRNEAILTPLDPSPVNCADEDRNGTLTEPPKNSRSRFLGPRAVRSTIPGEVAVALLASLLSVAWARSVATDPLSRIGQVSALAAIQLRFAVLGLLVVGAALVASRFRSPRAWTLTCNLAFAATSGLATGLVGAGLMIALGGTTWPLNGPAGDAGRLAAWARDIAGGLPAPAEYPPVILHLLAWWSELTGQDPSMGLRVFQIAGTALLGPVAYLSWRLVLSPPWALGIGLTAALPLVDAYKPYSNVVLIALLPLVVRFLGSVREAGRKSTSTAARAGIIYGILAGILFLTYSGWFVWSALGVFLALLLVFPWRSGALRALVCVGSALAAFLVLTASQLIDTLTVASASPDRYFYFDTFVQPAYVAMWRGDLSGNPGPWPPPGELGGVGLFSVLLVVGLGVSLALARKHPAVIAVSCCLLSAWIMRFRLASEMYPSGNVQLYPRTTPQILHCLLLLCGFAVYFLALRYGLRASTLPPVRAVGEVRIGVDEKIRQRGNVQVPVVSQHLGALSAMILLSAFAGGSLSDHYMPQADKNSEGFLSYVAQTLRQTNGSCPAATAPDRCVPTMSDVPVRMRGESSGGS